MNNSIYAIYGASGCGRSLMPIARQQLQRQGISAEIYFIDDSLKEKKNSKWAYSFKLSNF